MNYYLCAYTALISSILGIGFSVSSICKEKGNNRENALYRFVRSLALTFISIIPVCIKM